MTSLQSLPSEILVEIALFLPTGCFSSLCLTSKSIYEPLSRSEYLWEILTLRDLRNDSSLASYALSMLPLTSRNWHSAYVRRHFLTWNHLEFYSRTSGCWHYGISASLVFHNDETAYVRCFRPPEMEAFRTCRKHLLAGEPDQARQFLETLHAQDSEKHEEVRKMNCTYHKCALLDLTRAIWTPQEEVSELDLCRLGDSQIVDERDLPNWDWFELPTGHQSTSRIDNPFSGITGVSELSEFDVADYTHMFGLLRESSTSSLLMQLRVYREKIPELTRVVETYAPWPWGIPWIEVSDVRVLESMHSGPCTQWEWLEEEGVRERGAIPNRYCPMKNGRMPRMPVVSDVGAAGKEGRREAVPARKVHDWRLGVSLARVLHPKMTVNWSVLAGQTVGEYC